MATPSPRSHSLEPWSPSAFKPFYDEFQRTFDGFLANWPRLHDGAPAVKVDFAETDEAVEITAELPGMTEKDVSVELVGNVLTISGEKRQDSERKDKGMTISERSYGAFTRSLALPSDIDTAKINASVANGVLKVIAPRNGKASAQRIEVKAKA